MIALIGLLLVLAAAGVAVSGVMVNFGSSHPLGEGFDILGVHLTGLSTGQLFLYGVIVGAVGMLGLAMMFGAVNRRLASRWAQRKLKGSQNESAALREDRDRLTRQLDEEHAKPSTPSTPRAADTPNTTSPPPTDKKNLPE